MPAVVDYLFKRGTCVLYRNQLITTALSLRDRQTGSPEQSLDQVETK